MLIPLHHHHHRLSAAMATGVEDWSKKIKSVNLFSLFFHSSIFFPAVVDVGITTLVWREALK